MLVEVSVIIPVYNAAMFLHEALDSVLRQVECDFEVVCVDDGSTDESLAILREYAVKDSRVTVFTQANRGPGVARNVGLSTAKGKYITFLDADDCLCANDVLCKAFHAMEDLNCDCLLMNARAMRNDGSVGDVLPWCLRQDLIGDRKRFAPKELGDGLFYAMGPVPWSKLFRREFLVASGLSFPPLSRSEDFPFVELAIGLASVVGVLNIAFVSHRIATPGSLEQTKSADPLAFSKAEKILWQRIKSLPNHERLLRAAQARAMLRLDYNLRAMASEPCYSKVAAAARSIRYCIRVSPGVTLPDYSSTKVKVDKKLLSSVKGWRAIIYRFRVCLADNGFAFTLRRIFFGRKR